MAVFGVSITKSMEWRGAQQEFSNVYHYQTAVGQPFDDEGIIAAVVAAERPLHATSVTFETGRTWGPTENGPAASVMREIVDLSGQGGATPLTNAYKETALLISWPLGRYGSRNRPQFLRKWLHTLASGGRGLDGSSRSDVSPQNVLDYIAAVTALSDPAFGDLDLCTADGRVPVGPAVQYPYLEHRQLGDTWR